jgi:hypothetical protein
MVVFGELGVAFTVFVFLVFCGESVIVCAGDYAPSGWWVKDWLVELER